MGKRTIKVAGVSDAHAKKSASSLFKNTMKIEEISVQRMRKLAKTKPVYLAVVRTNEVAEQGEDPTNEDQIVTVNEDQTKQSTPCRYKRY